MWPRGKSLTKNSWQIPNQSKLLLFIVLSVNLVPLILELATWFIAFCSVVILWQWAVFKQVVGYPKRWMKSFIAIIGCILLIATGKSLGLLASMIHLLCLSFILKPLELNRRTDFYQFVILALLVLTTAFIFQQSVYFSVSIGAIFLLNITLLLSIFYQESRIKALAFYTCKLVLQSLPLAIALFLFFPKISPFWQVPQAKSTQTGLSDSLTIGDISKLALSNELAFRAEFVGSVPSYQQLYWRAMVLEKFDGKSWHRKYSHVEDIKAFAKVSGQRLTNVDQSDALIRYQIIQEKSFQPWLFVLDVGQLDAANTQRDIIMLEDYSLYLKGGVNQPVAYNVVSDLTAPLDLYESKRDIQYNLIIGDHSNPKLTHYGEQLQERSTDALTIVELVLSDFRNKNFKYTLEPPLIADNSLDTFFFDTQAGFCEHYASSFTFLMRAAGIPARVVLGYMGGTYNSQGKYYSVLQREAHAWSEVWVSGKGWVRVDPTSAVDPSRVSQGFSSQLLQEQRALGDFSFRQWLSGDAIEKLRYYIDMLDYQWTKAVINYSSQKQFNLLKNWFGKHFKVAAIVSIFILLAVIVLAFFLAKWLVSMKAQRKNPYIYHYDQMLKALANNRIVKHTAETDAVFISRLKMIDKDLAQQVAIATSCLNRALYATPETSTLNLSKMRAAVANVKRFKDYGKGSV